MASSFSDLGIELMATGENAGTWGDKTNTNLQIVEKSIAGYVEKAITSGGTTALTITDGDATESTSVARHAVIKLTGTISGNSIVTVPDSIEKVYIVTNGTSGAYTVQFKTASGTGITFGVSEKTTKLVYSDGTNIVDAGFSGASDMEGRELILDADGDTSITADTDDQIDIKIAGADDFQFTANTFTAQSGSSIVVPEGGLTFGSTAITSTAAELNLLDGVSGLVQADLTKLAAVDSTAAELNIVDGGTSATSTTVADADRVVLNDNGTMVQVAVTDLAAYFDDEITAMPNLTSVGTLTTLTVDNVIVNGTTIGHTDDTDLITLADGVATVAGEISVTTLDIGGTNVTATAAELNFIDGGATIGTTAIADGDGIIHNDGGTMKVTTAATFKTYFQSGVGIAADDISAGDAAINFTTSSGNITVDAAANDSDIIFKGTDNSSDITMLTLDGSDAGTAIFNHDIKLADDGKAIFGDGSDLQIHHNATNSFISNSTGKLFLTGAITEILNANQDEAIAKFNENGAVELYHNNSKKIETTSAGVTVTGGIIVSDDGNIGSVSDSDAIAIASDGVVSFSHDILIPNDSGQIKLGASGDLEIYHDGSHSHIRDAGTGDLRIRTSKLQLLNTSSHEYLVATSGGSVDIYHNDVKKFETTSAGVTVTGNILISDAGNIGSASDTDAIAISSGGVVTFSQSPVNSAGAPLKQAGKETIWVPAVAMYPNGTNGCADLDQTELSNGPELKTLDFDKDSDEFAQFAIAFPKSWNEGTITFQAFFTANSTNTGTTAWGLAGVALADDGSLNTAFGTTVVATAKAHSGTANDLDVTAESGAVTIAGSPSTDEYVFFQIQRDVSADDLTADAKLLGIKIFFTTDAANDA